MSLQTMQEASKVMQKKFRPKTARSFECNVRNCSAHEADHTNLAGCSIACAIYQVRIDGIGLSALTSLQPGIMDSFPVYSPSGLMIAFERRWKGGDYVLLMDRDGSNIHRLTPRDASAHNPAWSPDGSRIAFSCGCDATGTSGIWVIRCDGEGLTRLTYVHAMDALAAVDHLFPSWSPDGNFLAVEQHALGSDPKVVVVNLTKTGLRNQRSNQLLLGSQPSWSQAPSRQAGLQPSANERHLSSVPEGQTFRSDVLFPLLVRQTPRFRGPLLRFAGLTF
jgi:Tol biopolymer transport system component